MSAWGSAWSSAWGAAWGGVDTPTAGVGGGGANWVTKPIHKKVHDEVNEYFDRNGEVEAAAKAAERAVGIDNSAASQEKVSGALTERSKAQIHAHIEAQRNEELRALLAIAQDEDDAEAALLIMETLH